MNRSVCVSYVSNNLPLQFGSSHAAVTRILLTISSGHREVPSNLAGTIDPIEGST